MSNENINWDELPEVMTKEDFRLACHISKSTARFLLLSGKVPCLYTGTKTRCYKILKKDVIEYLKDREAYPEYYMASKDRYGKITRQGSLSANTLEIREDMHEYYAHLLSSFPDVLDSKTISEITGYGKTAINNWCQANKIRHFAIKGKNLIPKVYLIDFLCSVMFRTITRKSQWHIKVITSYYDWKYKAKNEV